MPIFTRWARGHRISIALLICVAAAAAAATAGLQDRAGFLWIAESAGVLNIATDSGAVRFEISQTHGTSALGVNDYTGDLWAYGDRRLLGFDRTGALRVDVDTPVPVHGGDPADLVVDGGAGILWFAIKRELYRYDLQGRLQQTLVLPRNVVAMALDRDRSVLWVAQEQQLELYDADGALIRSIDWPLTERIGDIAYDRRSGQVWLSTPDRLLRYDAEGQQSWEAGGNYAGFIAPDGAGGLWRARDSVLSHHDENGVMQRSLEPFAGQPDKAIVDLVADPHDASVWVASRRSVAHYAVDGEPLAHLQDVADGVIKKLSRSALYADLDAPELTIVAPAAGALLATGRPTIELEYFDLGVGVDTGSIRLRAGGAELAAACTATATSATCTPASALPDGEVVLEVTIADRMYNVSEALSRRFTLDTVPPEIRLERPAAGSFTNQPALAIEGTLSEAAALTLGDSSVAVSDALRFAAQRTLLEGLNTFALAAVDRAGNRRDLSFEVTLDTVAPSLPSASLIAVGEPENGRVRVTGAPGSAEAGAVVRVLNARTGQHVDVVVASDGSFIATLEAAAGDELRVSAIDRAGNGSGALSTAVPAGLGVVIAEPLEGATYGYDYALVAGTLKGPPNAAISVNGVPATMITEGSDARFYASVPLRKGWNELIATATLQSGDALTSRVNVNRVETPLTAKVTPPQITVPTTVRFDVAGGFDFNDRIRYDFNGDGLFEFTTGASLYGANFANYRYASPGVYRPVIEVMRYNYSKWEYEVIYRPRLSVVALDPVKLEQHRDRVLRSVWAGVKDALLSGKVQDALTGVTFDSRETYGEVFESLEPHMAGIFGDLTDIQPIVLGGEYAEYAVMNVRGTPRVHIVGFLRGADGIWRIDQF